MTEAQAEMVSDTFFYVLSQIIDPTNQSLGHVKLLGPKTHERLAELNRQLPQPIESCIHTDIQKYSLTHRAEPALCDADGVLTYGELEDASSSLAQYLVSNGVGPEVFVPVCCEKSRWVVVAVLATLKAGGAFILLDPSHPAERLRGMLQQDFTCPIILTTSKHVGLASSIVSNAVEIDTHSSKYSEDSSSIELSPGHPRSAAYVVFTSGSTGKPKASVIEHQSFRSAAEAHSARLNLCASSRVLQFASYAFDASVVEILTTLIVGGCICIPSELDRIQRLPQIINDLQVTWALLTPSVARTLNPLQVPTLKTLVLGGEGMSENDVSRWSSHVHLMNAYGPSECSVIATAQTSPRCLSEDPGNIGFPVGCQAWIVSPHTPEKLVPIGAVGELLIEGPIVGRGYMKRPDQTADAFPPDPQWLVELRGTQQGRIYRTGDLARLFPDGSIHYVGRKDRQVKLHGQRIELGEIEYQIQQCWPESNSQVFADLISPAESKNTYVVVTIASAEHNGKDSEFEEAAQAAELELQGRVPSFLIPYAFLHIAQIPRLLNGKVDRRQLREHASRGLQVRINSKEGSPMSKQQRQLTTNEQTLQQLWARVLHREADSIGPDDNFFRLGGDSILVMKLASLAGNQGLKIRVPDVFLHPRLKDLARIQLPNQQAQTITPEVTGLSEEAAAEPPFSLLPPEQRASAQEEAVRQCGVPADAIENIYPCTALQAGLAALTAERPGSYIAHHRFRLASNIDMDRLKAAWERVSARIDILRTRLIQTEFGCLQVVVRNCDLVWIVPGSNDQKLSWEMVFGQPLIQFEICPASDHIELHITLHHAVYDAWSLPLLIQWAELAYDNPESPKLHCTPFQTFIQYTMSQKEESMKYWRDHLRDCEADQFPALPFPSYRPRASKKVQRAIRTGPLMDDLISRTTAVRLSWALVQSQYQSSDDVVFGIVSSGRSAPVRGIEMVAGPTIATIPMSFSIKKDVIISQALADLQEQILQVTPYEQVGLSQIAALGPGATQACSFQTLLIEGRAEAEGEQSEIARPIKTTSDEEGTNAYVLELTLILGKEEVTVEAAFDETVLPEWQTQRILEHFGYILQRVHAEPQRLLGSISTVNPLDLNELKSWNREVPSLDPRTVIAGFQEHSSTRPCAPAVCAWDGKFSYGELDARSNTLASILQSHGVEPENFVPIYLDRSRWTAVAVLAVLKLGAAFVLLDTGHPHMRLCTICEELQPSIIITSIGLHAAAKSLVPNTVVVTEAALSGGSRQLTSVHLGPHQALYAVFTSGSTGKPKAAVVENGSFVTMAIPYAKELGLGADSRMLHFSSYAFDVSILEILGTLYIGGCICILSESERRDHLRRAITELQPSHAILTPSVLRAITPLDVSSVHTIMLIGEPVRTSDIEQWADRVHLLNTYGPAECTVVFTLQKSPEADRNAANIGFAIAGATWVTDPRDPHHLAPIGAVGELLLEGPLVGRGYLNNAEKTDASFIPSPRWMQGLFESEVSSRPSPRLYRTGDLVRYEEDGSLCFVGRRDCQVKLRGQRFELGEVEAQVQQNFPGNVEDIAAQVITPLGAVKTPCLAVFLALKDQTDPLQPPASSSIPTLDVVVPVDFGEKVKTLNSRLENVLPEYMIPSVFVPLKHLPRSIGGKIDRRKLRESVAKVSRQELNALFVSESSDTRRFVATSAERTLQQIWARALGIAIERIGVEDSFFRLGGDSISALQATSQARAVGIHHSVGDLFQWRNILQISKRFSQSSKAQTDSDDPNVDEIIPCTPAQRGILIEQMQVEDRYAAHFIWHVTGRNGPIDVDRLAMAWKAVISQHSALRATFRQHPSDDTQFEQVLLREVEAPIVIMPTESDSENNDVDDMQVPVALSASSADITWRSDGHFVPHKLTIHVSRSGDVFCRLDINHVIMDGKSLAVLEVDLCHAYDAQLAGRPQPDPYREYIKFVQNEPHEEAREYWRSYLKDMQPLDLPRPKAPAPSSGSSVETRERLELSLNAGGGDIESMCRSTDWTPSNLVYFAWALTLSAFSLSDDVCFAISTSGRLIPVAHIDGAVGQFSNMAICRVRLTPDITLNDIAIGMQQDYSQVLTYQSFPLAEISRAANVPVEAIASSAVIVHYPLPANMVAPLETYSIQLKQRQVLDPGVVSTNNPQDFPLMTRASLV
jgi:amino acid adenylation domain-containing protein